MSSPACKLFVSPILHWFYTCSASSSSVHIFAFNVHPEELDIAHTLLDKNARDKRPWGENFIDILQRTFLTLTYSDDHNFIIRYILGLVHHNIHTFWTMAISQALLLLTQPPHDPVPPRCQGIRATSMFHGMNNLSQFTSLHLAYQLGPGKNQVDTHLWCFASASPSIVLEVGSLESFIQLQTDMHCLGK